MANELSEVLQESERIVFFGGAGVSTESGIPDFRSGGGLYSQATATSYAPEEVLSHSFFASHTEEFYDYYRSHLLHPEARPNAAHLALARLDAAGKLTAVVTQNIDGLHQAAGSRTVLELHGSVHRNTCQDCGLSYGLDGILGGRGVPHCPACGGVIKPDVVLYEEALDTDVMSAAVDHISAADTLIVGGTSLVVYPAAGLVHAFGGQRLVLINKEATGFDHLATLVIHESIGATLAAAVPATVGK